MQPEHIGRTGKNPIDCLVAACQIGKILFSVIIGLYKNFNIIDIAGRPGNGRAARTDKIIDSKIVERKREAYTKEFLHFAGILHRL